MGNTRKLVLAGLLYCWVRPGLAAPAEQFIFYLRNRDRLSGAIVSEDTNRLVLATSWTNRLELPISQVERRERVPESAAPSPGVRSTPPEAPQAAGGGQAVGLTTRQVGSGLTEIQRQRLAELLTLYQADKITPQQYHEQRQSILTEPETKWTPLAKLPLAPPSVPAPSAKPTKPPAPPSRSLRQRLHLANWHGNLQVGMNLGYGNVHSETYNGLFQAAYAKSGFKDSLEYHLAYGRTEGQVSANRMDGSMKTELDFKKGVRLYGYHLGAAGYDEVRQITLNYQEGAGLGYHLFQRTNLVFNVELGGSYQDFEYANGTRNNFVSVRLGQEMTWKPWPKLVIVQRAQLIPNVGDLGDYKMRAETTVSYPFLKNLSLNLNLIDNYDSRPPLKVKHNDLQILSTVGYSF